MTGFAGPARLSDQMPCSGAGTSVLRSGHFKLSSDLFSIGRLFICTLYVAAFFGKCVGLKLVHAVSHVAGLVEFAAAFPLSICVFIDLIFLCNT